MTSLQAVVFDFDGVILESAEVKTDAFVELYAGHGSAVDQAVIVEGLLAILILPPRPRVLLGLLHEGQHSVRRLLLSPLPLGEG